MSKIFNLKVDKEQTKGRWFDFYIDDAYMGQVKISCAKKNKEFAKKVVDINTHYSKEIKSGKNEEQVLQALYFAYANSIVLGVKDTKGKEYQLSNEDIVEMFKDEDTGTELFNFVQDKCSKITNFLEEKKEEIVKKVSELFVNNLKKNIKDTLAIKKFIEQAKKAGDTQTVERLENELKSDDIDDWLGFYVLAFNDLSRCRTIGEYPQSIGYFDCVNYAKRFNVADEEFFIEVMQSVDDNYLSAIQKIRSEEIKKAQNGNKKN